MPFREIDQPSNNSFREIKAEEPRSSGNPVTNFGVGIGSGIGQAGLGLGQAFLKLSGKVGGVMGYDENQYSGLIDNLEKLKKKIYVEPFEERLKTTSGSLGKTTADIATFLEGSNPITKGQDFLRGLTSSVAEKGIPGFIGRTASRVIPEAIGTGITEYGISGGDWEKAKTSAEFAGAASGVLGAAGDLSRYLFSPALKDSVTKGLGMTGSKTSAGKILNKPEDYIEGLSVIKKRAPTLKVKDADGIEKVFDPKEATYGETLQAWNQARKQIYDEYHQLASKSSEAGDVTDLGDIFDTLTQMTKSKRTSPFKSAIQRTMKDLTDNFGIYDDAGELIGIEGDAVGIEKFLEDLNHQAASILTSGTSDRALGEISASTSKLIRDRLDETISNATGEGYQALRSEYSSLKAIESALVDQYKKSARKIGGGLSDYLNILNSGDIINGAISGNPAWVGAGIAKGIMSIGKKITSDPERYLRRSFQLLDENNQSSDLTKRIFGSQSPSASFKEGHDMIKNTFGETQKGSTDIGTLLGGSALGGAALSYGNPDLLNEEDNVVEKKEGPDGKNIYKLKSGTEVRDIHPKIEDKIEKIYKDNPELDKGILEALLMKESSMGYDDSNKNKKNGKYGWLGGITPIAQAELKRNGIKFNLDTIEGVLDAMAKFWAMKSKGDPVKTYESEYSSGKLPKEDIQAFKDMVEYYQQLK